MPSGLPGVFGNSWAQAQNSWRALKSWLETPSAVFLGSSIAQPFATGVITPVVYQDVGWDPTKMFKAATPSRITATRRGMYFTYASLGWEGAMAQPWFGMIKIIRPTGVGTIAASWFPSAFQSEGTLAASTQLNVGDYLEFFAFQFTGVAKNTGVSNLSQFTFFSATWIGHL